MKKLSNIYIKNRSLMAFFVMKFALVLIPLDCLAKEKKGDLYGFIENKGQILDQYLKVNSDVKFLMHGYGYNLHLRKNGISYETISPLKNHVRNGLHRPFKFSRVDVEFIGANKNPDIVGEIENNKFTKRVYLASKSQEYFDIKSYLKVTYRNLYPNIDLEYISNSGNVKFNFVLRKGANINDIKWQYKGGDNTQINNNKVSIKCGNIAFEESIPESYIIFDSSSITKSVNISYQMDAKKIFMFKSDLVKPVDEGQILVVDPILNVSWATFFGDGGDERILSSTCDKLGNTYCAGTTSSPSSIATTGAHQVIYNGGGGDGFITKFDSNGLLLWSTYFGGVGYDYVSSIVIDKQSDLIVSGITDSNALIATSGSHQTTYGGGPSDAFLAKFTNSGAIVWSTYYGGLGDDQSASCHVDTLQNIYLSGFTTSSNNIASAAAYQLSYSGASYDGFIAKFNPNGLRQWGSYFGNNGDDRFYSCKADLNGDVYCSGSTTSSLSISSSSAHQTNYGKNKDAMLVKFNTNGLRIWSTYYGGSGKEDGWDISIDSLRNIYLIGNSTSVDSISTLGSHQITYSGAGAGMFGDAYLTKFDSSGVRIWGTYYGGSNDESGIKVIAKSQSLYICGVTQSTSQISTPNTYQNTITPPWADMFLAKFDLFGTRQWGTYVGRNGNDVPHSMHINSLNEIFLCGATDDPAFPVTAGAYQTLFTGTNEGVIVKFSESAIGTGLFDLKEESFNLNSFPNPNNGSFIIQSTSDMTVNILNELSQIIKTIKLDDLNNHKFTISNLAPGVYTIISLNNKQPTQNKVIVIK